MQRTEGREVVARPGANRRVELARAVVRVGADDAKRLREALRSYVRAARAEGLSAASMLADMNLAWQRRARGVGGSVSRDVLEVATLLEFGACDEPASSALRD